MITAMLKTKCGHFVLACIAWRHGRREREKERAREGVKQSTSRRGNIESKQSRSLAQAIPGDCLRMKGTRTCSLSSFLFFMIEYKCFHVQTTTGTSWTMKGVGVQTRPKRRKIARKYRKKKKTNNTININSKQKKRRTREHQKKRNATHTTTMR